MRKQLLLGVVAALGLCSSSALAAKTNFTTGTDQITGESGATGTGDFTYDDVTKILCGKITLGGTAISPTKVELVTNFEEGEDPEAQQDFTASLTSAKAPIASPITFTAVVTPQALIDALTQGNSFISIHTAAFDAPLGATSGGLTEGGAGATCVTVADAGTDAGKTTTPPVTTTSSSSSSSSSGDDTSGSSSTVDAGKASSSDSGGCSTVGDSNAASGLGLVTIASMGLALILRGRGRRRK